MTKIALLRLSSFLLVFCSLSVHAQTVTTFEGIDASQEKAPQFDVDPNGAVGTKQFMEWANPYYQAWDKTTFAPVWSVPQPGTTPFTVNGNSNCTNIRGDGVVIFDRLASRWVIAAHNSGSTNYYYCIAISNTDDLTSTTLAWYTYAIPLNNILGTNAQGLTYFPDWPKISTWSDAYYLALDLEDPSNGFQEVGVLACALDRTNMLHRCNAEDSPVLPQSGSDYRQPVLVSQSATRRRGRHHASAYRRSGVLRQHPEPNQ